MAAFVIGFLFAVIGSPIAGFATSYYLRSRKIKQLKSVEPVAKAVRFKKEAYEMEKTTEKLIQCEAGHYKLTNVPPVCEKRLVKSDPMTHYQKPTGELLPPTVKAALWRRAYLYR